jgi:plastocyanin
MCRLLGLIALTFAALSCWAADEKQKSEGDSKSGVTVRKAGVAGRATSTVSITDAAFMDATLTVNAGDIVTWTNNGTVTHTVTSDTAGIFDSGNIISGDTFTFTFANQGQFNYHCSIHPELTGTVTVNALGGGTSGGTNITGNWSGKVKGKLFKQTGADLKAINSNDDTSAALVHLTDTLSGTFNVKTSEGPETFNVTGKIGNSHFWMSGADGSGEDSIVISGHVSKKGDSFKGTGIIYKKQSATEISFSLKKQ